MKKLFIVQDNLGRDYEIPNIENFYQHPKEFHLNGISVHEEEGRYFIVNDNFREKIKKMFDSRKWPLPLKD